jgi:hypothetical protein
MKKYFFFTCLIVSGLIFTHCSSKKTDDTAATEFEDTTVVKDSATQKAQEMLDFKFF